MYHIEVTKSASDWHSWWDGHKANQNRQRYPFMFEEEKYYFFKTGNIVTVGRRKRDPPRHRPGGL